jgi:hypothetical protein
MQVPGSFELLSTPELEQLLLRQGVSSGSQTSGEKGDTIRVLGARGREEAGGGISCQPRQAPFPPPPPPCYCQHKLHIKFVDMLTYPRPIRKFQVSHTPIEHF